MLSHQASSFLSFNLTPNQKGNHLGIVFPPQKITDSYLSYSLSQQSGLASDRQWGGDEKIKLEIRLLMGKKKAVCEQY